MNYFNHKCARLGQWFTVKSSSGFKKNMIFTPIWGRFPIWLILFNWVETTNQYCVFLLPRRGTCYLFESCFSFRLMNWWSMCQKKNMLQISYSVIPILSNTRNLVFFVQRERYVSTDCFKVEHGGVFLIEPTETRQMWLICIRRFLLIIYIYVYIYMYIYIYTLWLQTVRFSFSFNEESLWIWGSCEKHWTIYCSPWNAHLAIFKWTCSVNWHSTM